MVFVIFLFLLIMLALALFVDAMIVFGWYRLHKLTTKYLDGVYRIDKELAKLKKELDELHDNLDEFSKDQA